MRILRYSPTVMVWAWHLWLMQNLQSPWLAELPEYRYCIQKSVAVETMRSTRAATPQSVPPPAKVYSIVRRPGEVLSSWTFSDCSGKRGQSGGRCMHQAKYQPFSVTAHDFHVPVGCTENPLLVFLMQDRNLSDCRLGWSWQALIRGVPPAKVRPLFKYLTKVLALHCFRAGPNYIFYSDEDPKSPRRHPFRSFKTLRSNSKIHFPGFLGHFKRSYF